MPQTGEPGGDVVSLGQARQLVTPESGAYDPLGQGMQATVTIALDVLL